MMCQVGQRNRSLHHDVKQNAISHTENNRKEIMKVGLDLLAAHPSFEQNSLLLLTARSFWHIHLWPFLGLLYVLI